MKQITPFPMKLEELLKDRKEIAEKIKVLQKERKRLNSRISVAKHRIKLKKVKGL